MNKTYAPAHPGEAATKALIDNLQAQSDIYRDMAKLAMSNRDIHSVQRLMNQADAASRHLRRVERFGS